MKKTLEILNTLVIEGIVDKYSICGGMAHFYYIEPSVTYDLDIVVRFNSIKNELTPLSGLYEWARANNYEIKDEHIIIEGLPVQFLPEYNPLVCEALETAVEIIIFDTKTFIFKSEYLMAIMLETNRPKDRERLLQFLQEAEFSESLLEDIFSKFNLTEKYISFKRKSLDE